VLSSPAVEVPLILVLTAALQPAPTASVEGAVALARRIQEHHRTVRDMRATFTHSYTSGLLGRKIVEHGTVAIKRPDRMRWEYDSPDKKLYVSDGRKYYSYVPADRQVVVQEASENQGTAFQLLSGRADLLGEFQAFPVEGEPQRVRLVPRGADAEVREIVVDADDAGRIERLEILDLQGNHMEFRFREVKENTAVPDRLFDFKVPAGVEVVSG
jgi:outer membrane lipoprotein carrier protein